MREGLGGHGDAAAPPGPSVQPEPGFGASVRPVGGVRLPAPYWRARGARAGVALFGRRVEGPVRVVEVRAGQGAEVGAAREEQELTSSQEEMAPTAMTGTSTVLRIRSAYGVW